MFWNHIWHVNWRWLYLVIMWVWLYFFKYVDQLHWGSKPGRVFRGHVFQAGLGWNCFVSFVLFWPRHTNATCTVRDDVHVRCSAGHISVYNSRVVVCVFAAFAAAISPVQWLTQGLDRGRHRPMWSACQCQFVFNVALRPQRPVRTILLYWVWLETFKILLRTQPWRFTPMCISRISYLG